jgi:hypothetical protein
LKQSNFIPLLKDLKRISTSQSADLKSIIDKFPYFQSARALYLKDLKNQNNFKYNNQLRVTAAHTTDRTVLFHFITSTNFVKKDNLKEVILKKLTLNKELSIGKPFSFNESETFSFNEWLQLSIKKEINREKKVTTKLSKKDLIDSFIQNNPKITPIKTAVSKEIFIKKNTQQSQLMTATLAKVYLEQKKYENAIQAYRILSLKYPEKSGFFANQIKRIQILQNKIP